MAFDPIVAREMVRMDRLLMEGEVMADVWQWSHFCYEEYDKVLAARPVRMGENIGYSPFQAASWEADYTKYQEDVRLGVPAALAARDRYMLWKLTK